MRPSLPSRSRVVCVVAALAWLAAPSPTSADVIDFSAAAPAQSVTSSKAGFGERAAIVSRYQVCQEGAKKDLRRIADGADDWGERTLGIALGALELAARHWPTGCRGPANAADVNDALRHTRVRSEVGTTMEFPCAARPGEYDINLRYFTTFIYRYGGGSHPVLASDVRAHIRRVLLNQRGKHNPAIDGVTCVLDLDRGPSFLKALHKFLLPPGLSELHEHLTKIKVRVPETENHLLQTESSRYLTNQLFWMDLHKYHVHSSLFRIDSARWNNVKNGMHAYILKRLQGFLKHDFYEYNAHPYEKYSTGAVQNLYDFADPHAPGGAAVKKAARMVLDYLSAKFAASSNNLRRMVPFRRRGEYFDRRGLLNGDDEATNRFIVLSGATQALGPGYGANPGAKDSGEVAAATSYRVPDLILDLIIDGNHRYYYQRIHHGGVEIYAATPTFLISAGGIWQEPRDLGEILTVDLNTMAHDEEGEVRPTTLIPTVGSDSEVRNLIHFDGVEIAGVEDKRNQVQTCVVQGFACGERLVIPAQMLNAPDCAQRQGTWMFIDASGGCDGGPAYGFYVAAYGNWEQQPNGDFRTTNTGFFEAIPSGSLYRGPHVDFAAFRQRVLAANHALDVLTPLPPAGGYSYNTIDGRQIHFYDPSRRTDKYGWLIASIDDPRGGHFDDQDISRWGLASGDIISSTGNGRVQICNPATSQRLILDMRDWRHPDRTQQDLRGAKTNCGDPRLPTPDPPPPPQFIKDTVLTAQCPGLTQRGASVTIGGLLSPAVSRAGVQVTLTRPDGAEVPVIVPVDGSGGYSMSMTVDQPGSWQVAAGYAGDTGHRGSRATCAFPVSNGLPGIQHSLTLTCSGDVIDPLPVSVAGALYPGDYPPSYVEIAFYRDHAPAPEFTQHVDLDSDGNYGYVFSDWASTHGVGHWSAIARYLPDEHNQGAESRPCSFSYAQPPK